MTALPSHRDCIFALSNAHAQSGPILALKGLTLASMSTSPGSSVCLCYSVRATRMVHGVALLVKQACLETGHQITNATSLHTSGWLSDQLCSASPGFGPTRSWIGVAV